MREQVGFALYYGFNELACGIDVGNCNDSIISGNIVHDITSAIIDDNNDASYI